MIVNKGFYRHPDGRKAEVTVIGPCAKVLQSNLVENIFRDKWRKGDNVLQARWHLRALGFKPDGMNGYLFD